MIVHKCDSCGKEMTRWFSFVIRIGAINEYANISDMIGLTMDKEFCKECVTAIAATINKEDKAS